jgi:putative addiction module CopG family antidote
MSSKYALSVSLTAHLCEFIDSQVKSGRYGTASEVLRDALRLLERTQHGYAAAAPVSKAGSPSDIGSNDGVPQRRNASTDRRAG